MVGRTGRMMAAGLMAAAGVAGLAQTANGPEFPIMETPRKSPGSRQIVAARRSPRSHSNPGTGTVKPELDSGLRTDGERFCVSH